MILPAPNQERLLAHAQLCIADRFNNATLVWTNIVNKTSVLKYKQKHPRFRLFGRFLGLYDELTE